MPDLAFFCYDGSDGAREAIRAAGEVLPGGPGIVATAWQPLRHSAVWSPGLLAEVGGGMEEIDRTAEEQALTCATDGCAIAGDAGFDAEPIACKAQGAIWATLMHRAEEHDASVIVVGRRGRSAMAAAVLGSVSLGLVSHASRPITVVP